MNHLSIRKRLSSLLLVTAGALALSCGVATSANAQANVTFSGGLGAPLTLTLNAPVTYQITSAYSGTILFDIQAPTDTGNTFFFTVTGNVSYSLNGAAATAINRDRNGYTSGNATGATASDLLMFNSAANQNFVVGNTVVLNAGTITSTTNYAGAAPASGSYQTFIANNVGLQVSTLGVPEPGTWAMLSVASVGGLWFWVHRPRHQGGARSGAAA